MTKRIVNHVGVVVRTEQPMSERAARELVNDVLNDNEYKFTSPTTFEAKNFAQLRRTKKPFKAKPTY